MKRRTWKRRLRHLGVLLSLAALGGSMVNAVERGARARALSTEIERLEVEAAASRGRLTEAMRRLDSLTGRERITRAAGALGLRPASDEEIVFLRERRVDEERDEDR